MAMKTAKEMAELDNPTAPMRPGSKGHKRALRKVRGGKKKQGKRE